jgi:hypothetical protein
MRYSLLKLIGLVSPFMQRIGVCIMCGALNQCRTGSSGDSANGSGYVGQSPDKVSTATHATSTVLLLIAATALVASLFVLRLTEGVGGSVGGEVASWGDTGCGSTASILMLELICER